jgi:hypothetical protein
MRELEALTASFPYPIWTAAAAAAVAVAIVFVVFRATGIGGVLRFGGHLFVAAVVIGAVWLLVDRASRFERASDRRALDERSAGLTAQAVAPGSALACLDAMAGETTEAACEQAVFAGPSAIAAAVSYTAARLKLLADGAAHAQRGDRGYAPSLAPLRQALESDRFGIVAHVLALRDSCTELQCDAFSLLQDASRVQANLRDRTFDMLVGRHSAEWPGKMATTAATTATTAAPTIVATPPSPQFDFPSAASIPPVSIMNAEPAPAPAAAPSARRSATPPVPPRRPPPAARTATPPARSAPVQITPPAAAADGAAD